jgi:hypothetical protein
MAKIGRIAVAKMETSDTRCGVAAAVTNPSVADAAVIATNITFRDTL